MFTSDNFEKILDILKFKKEKNIYYKHFRGTDSYLKIDISAENIIYPEDKGLKINERQTCNFSANENFVVFECVHRLLEKGYKPEHLELEPKWKVGHGASGGRADILIKDNNSKPLLLIECKTFGKEFEKAWKDTQIDGGQLFGYAQQIPDTKFLCLYTSGIQENNNITAISHIISHTDNTKILEENKNLKSFVKATNVKERFEVWKETYLLEYTTKGIFEPNIQPYQIGKDKYTIEDLQPIDAKNKEGKYHEFRTILRKHNVSGRENAFDILVNLFLCKIVDETQNPKDLKFFWKGVAYDNYFDLIDRLQELYKIGMDKFLNQEIVYISNKEIDEAFWTVKQKPNATKQQIKEYFRKLKFFTNNDFGFVDVHNEKLFYQNAKILLEIVQMWQDLRLKTKEQNQFLGDMFEFFLDNGVKQSEGQFFTPLPICKFILMSLPLEKIIREHTEPPRTIDYACGAGHFLTEYAQQIKPFIEKYKQIDISAYYKAITGIEKEYRLSKTAKLSSFMYGQDGIDIIYYDALARYGKIKDNYFDILVTNPPFSVEGFLETLGDKIRAKYELTDTVSDISNNRNIQCFFIERAKQILAPNAVAGIIAPSSVLSNSDTTHIATREIILKYFDIVSLVELGSGTFGKTGTNTIILFLRRKAQLPEPAEHYKNRVNDWFDENDMDKETEIYDDEYLIKKYCEHIEIAFEDYKTLLEGKPSGKLFDYDIFKDYQKDFDASADIKNLKTKKFYKDMSETEQQAEIRKRLLSYLQKIEKEKLYYWTLAFSVPQKVLIVKSPAGNKEQKNFLGYEWSAAKGSEGIKYNGGDTVDKIITPLFDPKNPNNPEKINYYIQKNFCGEEINQDEFEKVSEYAEHARLVDLLDFSRKDFNKAISLSPKKNMEIVPKWEMVKIENFVSLIESGSRPQGGVGNINSGILSLGGEHIHNFDGTINLSNPKYVPVDFFDISAKGILKKYDILICKDGALTGKIALLREELYNQKAMVNEHIFIIRCGDIINQKYLFYFLFCPEGQKILKNNITGAAQGGLNSTNLKNIFIPNPEYNIQKKIVDECEAIDKESEKAKSRIENNKNSIENILEKLLTSQTPIKKLTEISIINPSKSEIRDIDENTIISFVEMASVSNNGFIEKKVDKTIKEVKKGSYTYFKENDIIIAKITPCMENGKCALATELQNNIGFGSSEFHVIRANSDILPKFIFSLINREKIRKEAEKKMTGASGHRRVPASFYENLKIPIPNLETQKKIVTDIEKSEKKIMEAKKIIDEASNKKQAVMKKYL